MVVHAPAKLNLYLKVIQRRSDGYHEIETLFEKISIFDRIVIKLSSSHTTIICNNPHVPTGDGSLLARTISLFQERSKKPSHFHVTVEKNIPIAAGLGGGSSDAAALLKGINQLTSRQLQDKDLVKIAQELGADVPFFLSSSSFGIGKGRGDLVEDIDVDTDLWHIVVNPGFEVLTKEVYEKISLRLPPSSRLRRTGRRIKIKKKRQEGFSLTKPDSLDRMFTRSPRKLSSGSIGGSNLGIGELTAFLKKNDITGLAENLCNDLEPIVLHDYPVLNDIITKLKFLGAKGVLLSGSGPSIFGIFDNDKVKKAALEARRLFLVKEKWLVFVAKTYRETKGDIMHVNASTERRNI